MSRAHSARAADGSAKSVLLSFREKETLRRRVPGNVPSVAGLHSPSRVRAGMSRAHSARAADGSAKSVLLSFREKETLRLRVPENAPEE
jgi:predicted transcriptional regulator